MRKLVLKLEQNSYIAFRYVRHDIIAPDSSPLARYLKGLGYDCPSYSFIDIPHSSTPIMQEKYISPSIDRSCSLVASLITYLNRVLPRISRRKDIASNTCQESPPINFPHRQRRHFVTENILLHDRHFQSSV